MRTIVKNLPEFKALIERYETITLKEVEEARKKWSNVNMDDLRRNLTGFGRYDTCTLCIAVSKDNDRRGACYKCVYGSELGCLVDKTSMRLVNANTPLALVRAYRARAKYMRSLLEETK